MRMLSHSSSLKNCTISVCVLASCSCSCFDSSPSSSVSMHQYAGRELEIFFRDETGQRPTKMVIGASCLSRHAYSIETGTFKKMQHCSNSAKTASLTSDLGPVGRLWVRPGVCLFMDLKVCGSIAALYSLHIEVSSGKILNPRLPLMLHHQVAMCVTVTHSIKPFEWRRLEKCNIRTSPFTLKRPSWAVRS